MIILISFNFFFNTQNVYSRSKLICINRKIDIHRGFLSLKFYQKLFEIEYRKNNIFYRKVEYRGKQLKMKIKTNIIASLRIVTWIRKHKHKFIIS